MKPGLLILIINFVLLGQVETGQKSIISVNPFFYYSIMTYYSEDSLSSRTDVYVQVPYNQLTFVKENNNFISNFEVVVSFLDVNDKLIKEKVWFEKVLLNNYEESVSRNSYNLSVKSFYLKSGKYNVKIHVENKESGRNADASVSYSLRDFSANPFSLSDIMLISSITEESSSKRIIPNISRNVVFNKNGFYILAEFYNKSGDSLFIFNCKIENKNKEVIYDSSFSYTTHLSKSNILYLVNTAALPLGEYKMSLIVAKPGDTSYSYKVFKEFYSKWTGLPNNLNDLDKAIDEMIYVTDRTKINQLKDIKDPQQKQQAFFDFWKVKDPTPETEENEIMEEYYSRVDYATKNFSSFMVGWKTDMGMVFIVLGPPDNVERYPFNYNSPAHEIWQYYKLNRSFIFVDYNGFGDYRLLNRDYLEFFKYR